jgi:hypothetical protein
MDISEKVIDSYLIWEICKQRGLQEELIEGSIDAEQVSGIIENVKQEYQEKDYSFDRKVNKLKDLDSNPGYRLKIFKGCSWSKETVNIRDLGTSLPRAGDLPPEVISGSLSEVVEFVKDANSEEYQSVKYINNLKQISDALDQFPPWVVTPGNRQEKIERMNKVHGKKDWNIEGTWGMINDGNHRTIAKVIAGNLEEIECFVGYRIPN